MIRELANGRPVEYKGATLQFPWSDGVELEVWVAAYGPLALKLTGEVGDGFILQLADLDIAAWMIAAVREAAERARAATRTSITVLRRRARCTSATTGPHMRDQCRWFGGMVGNHVADIVARYGADGARPRRRSTDYIAGREGYDYNEHGRAGNTHADFVPDEIVDRFCILGTAAEHIDEARGSCATLGVDQFAGYLQHDNKEETLRVYGETVIPALRDHVVAKA